MADLQKQKIKTTEEVITTTPATPPSSEETSEVVPEEQPVEITLKPRKRLHLKERVRRPLSDFTSTTTTTQKPTSRRGVNTRRDFATRNRFPSSTPIAKVEPQIPTIRNSSLILRRPPKVGLRERIEQLRRKEEKVDVINEEPIIDNTESNNHVEEVEYKDSVPQESATDAYHHETSIMKIAKDDHSYRPYAHSTESSQIGDESNDLTGSSSDYSQRVAELTLSNSEFKSVNTGLLSRRVPGYFTLATEDPILPIEAFFPAVKKD